MAVVTLKYGGTPSSVPQATGSQGQAAVAVATFMADPPVLQIAPGDSISFQLGAESPKGEILVTFDEPQFFSAPQFRAGDPPVTLSGKLSHRTFYKCELFVDGKLIGAGDGPKGGGIEPSGNTRNA